MLLTNCASARLVRTQSPNIIFPTFPSVTEASLEGDKVIISLQTWLEIVKYAVDVDAIDKTLQQWQVIDGGENDKQ